MPADINVIAENLSELLTNSVNMTAVFYDLFINPEPMDITLKQYDDNNRLIEIVVPNRAKDRRIALSGEGSPEGKVAANVGTCYVDTRNNLVYFKARGIDEKGWVVTLTESSIQPILDKYVPTTRQINKKPLDTDINISAEDIGALGKDTSYGNSLSVLGSNLNLKDQTGKVISTVPIATGGADIDLSNISPLGEKRISITKGYKTGKVSFDKRMYEELSERKRSTFDKSKFTVIGTPTITGDGIASGFNNERYVTVNKVFSDLSNFKITTPIYKIDGASQTGAYNGIFSILPNDGSLHIEWFQAFDGQGTTQKILLDNVEVKREIIEIPDIFNKKLYAEYEFNNNIFSIDTYANNILINHATFEYNKNISITAPFQMGRNLGDEALNGSIDLKAFAISVDDKEVFSGNKTGIDIIKPDNFEVIGNPVISEDGVASGFSNNVHLVKELSVTSCNKITIKSKFTYTPIDGQNSYIYFGNGVYGTPGLFIFNNRDILAYCYDGSVNGGIRVTPSEFPINEDEYVYSEYEITNEQRVLKLSKDGKNWFVKKDNGLCSLNLPEALKRIYIGNDFSHPFKGFLDLNEFKIYTDGNLVYQPCLKIPYIESKTGSKIVDAQYRDRVQDVSDQFGKALYYTIDEVNKNTTLPIGELYGFIGTTSSSDNGSSYKNSSGHYLGEWIMTTTANSVTPEGCVKPDGLEILNADESMFADLWKYALSLSPDWRKPVKLPTFASNTQDGYTVSDSKGNANIYQVFNGTNSFNIGGAWTNYSVQIKMPIAAALGSYSITAGSSAFPASWKIQGSNDGTKWEDVDVISAQVFTANETKNYPVAGEKDYKIYLLTFTSGDGTGLLNRINYHFNKPGTYLDTCTYAEYEKSVKDFGACVKWAVDPVAKKFKVPFVPDGYYMKQGKGTVNKAGLPNITGEVGQGYNSSGINGGWHNSGNTGKGKGALFLKGTNAGDSCSWSSYGDAGLMNIDASRSNPIYGASSTVETNAVGVRWFIYIANAELGEFAVNWNKMQDTFAQKADVDLSNLTPAAQDKLGIVIKEAYVNGTSGYNVYSNGYCEQWGFSTFNNTAIHLYKAYANSNYNITTGDLSYSINGTIAGAYTRERTPSYFIGFYQGTKGDVGSGTAYWVTRGYIK